MRAPHNGATAAYPCVMGILVGVQPRARIDNTKALAQAIRWHGMRGGAADCSGNNVLRGGDADRDGGWTAGGGDAGGWAPARAGGWRTCAGRVDRATGGELRGASETGGGVAGAGSGGRVWRKRSGAGSVSVAWTRDVNDVLVPVKLLINGIAACVGIVSFVHSASCAKPSIC